MKQTWIYGVFALLVGIGAAWLWLLGSSEPLALPPEDFAADVLVQEVFNVQGNAPVTTVYRDGRLVYEPSFLMVTNTEPQTYELSEAEMIAIEQAIEAAGPEIRQFERESGVLYEGTYLLRTNLDEYREHAAQDEALQQITAVWEPYLP